MVRDTMRGVGNGTTSIEVSGWFLQALETFASAGKPGMEVNVFVVRYAQEIHFFSFSTLLSPLQAYTGMLDRFVTGCEAEARKAMRDANEAAAAATGGW